MTSLQALVLALASGVVLALSPAATAAPPDLWLLPDKVMTPPERLMALTLQGLTAKGRPRVWIEAGGISAVLLEEMKKEGVRVRPAASVWEVLRDLRASVRGAVLCKMETPSVNVATSLCGPLRAVALDETLLDRARAAGLPVLQDARGLDEKQAFAKCREKFGRGVVVEQPVGKYGHLRDFAVQRSAFTFSTDDRAFRTEVARAFGPQALVYGWGPDEYPWVEDISKANATGVPSDWALNLSGMALLPAGRLRRPALPVPRPEEGTRYVAFVMSDGDNVQVMAGGFVSSPGFWASPLRGTFPMTWEMPPVLAGIAPRALRHFYRTAAPGDGFVTGPGAPGYTFPHFQPDRKAVAAQAAPLLKMADLRIVSVLNANEGSLTDTIPLLERPEVDGVIYKDYAPYHRRRGETLWHRGKPCVSYRFVLWEGLMSPEQIAQEVAKMPSSPATDEGSYALVNVHAWSYGSIGGPMEAVRRTIAQLPPNTRVIAADQLLGMLRANFAHKHP